MKKIHRIWFLPLVGTLFISSCNTNTQIPVEEEKPKPPIIEPEIPIEPEDPNIPKGWSKFKTKNPSDANQIGIDSARELHFNFPHYDNQDLMTLRAIGIPTNNTPTPGTPSGSNQWAQENIITTEKHVQLAKQCFALSFRNGHIEQKTGTAWILDYKLTDDGSYPLIWYFGTNAHVIDDLRVKDDTYFSEKFGQWDNVNKSYRANNTKAISLWKLADPKIGEHKNTIYGGEWIETRVNFYDSSKEDTQNWKILEGFYLDKTPIKTIFIANNFLSTSPSDFSTNSYSNKEEYADFGVFELTFDNEQQAREATNNYAEWKEEDKFKYHEEDLVKNPSLKTSEVYEIGYPDDGGYRHVAINVNSKLYSSGQNYLGSGLSGSRNYNNWTNVEGVFDALIALPSFGYEYEWVDNNINNQNSYTRTTSFSSYGLMYGTNNGNMRPGSSGALVVDANGYALGIHFASDNNAATGGAQAFYSSGYSYNGYYGKYNLPQYDLIRGGGKLQTKSYYDGMVQRYGKDPKFKTRLFPNGLISNR